MADVITTSSSNRRNRGLDPLVEGAGINQPARENVTGDSAARARQEDKVLAAARGRCGLPKSAG
jgi:hypothetical protein